MSAETDAVEAMLSARPGAVAEALPSARGVALHKVMGKMFAILEVRRARYLILKCDPLLVEILKEQYAGVGHRSHLDRRFWICIDLDADVPAEEVERLVGQSYDLVRATLTRKQQAELAALAA